MIQQSHCWVHTQRKQNVISKRYKCTPMFIAALFTIAKTQKQAKCRQWKDKTDSYRVSPAYLRMCNAQIRKLTIFIILHHFIQRTWGPKDFGIHRGSWNQCPTESEGWLYMEYYSALKRLENIVICDNIGELRQHHAKWNKPGRERQLMHGITYKWFHHLMHGIY